MKKRTPNLFIIGAPKCGTTSLFRYLSEHPDIFIPAKKEPNFLIYDNLKKIDARSREVKKAIKTPDGYLNLYMDSGDEKYLLDGTVFVYSFDDALKKLKEMSPDYKAVIILRNPVLRFISHYKMSVNLNDVKKPIEEYIKSPICGMGMNTLELGLYSKRLKRVFEILGSDRVHVLLLDNLKQNVEETLLKLYDFLEINRVLPENCHKVYLKNPGIAKSAFFRRIYVKSKFLKLVKKIFRKTPIYKLKNGINKKLYSDLVISQEINKTLFEYYENDIYELENILGRKLDYWRPDVK